MNIYQRITRFYTGKQTEKLVIGESVFGRKIYALKVGEGRPIGLAQYAIHGREFITAELAIKQFAVGAAVGSIWFVPLVNPDGALLSQIGLSSVPIEQRKELLSINGKSEDFSLWKANGRGVDLNVNFAADWGKGVKNLTYPNPENYIGERPFSEPESKALRTFTKRINPDYTVSYHTKGEEIYWYYYQPISACVRDKMLALALARSTGYALSQAKGSVGGYKDWCIKSLKIPSFTIEAGHDERAHPLRSLGEIENKNLYALYDLSKEFARL